MIPTSLYLHMPWCIRKCPYCDFNSHQMNKADLPEEQYLQALIRDLDEDLCLHRPDEIHSIFIGGGTPSLFSDKAYRYLLDAIKQRIKLGSGCEITMEANPGTVEQARFADYREAGINRLSLGIQSFNPQHLKTLGRIHDDEQAHRAIETARAAGFDNINLDLMHGLPKQSLSQGLQDLETALACKPEHLSWYQLTIEPNTLFYKQQPPLPEEDELADLEQSGFALLNAAGYQRYEISAFSRGNRASAHNLNYWLFGDYFGIGAGAHGKLTTAQGIIRTRKHRQPKDYLNPDKPFLAEQQSLSPADCLFEFMLNSSRLEAAIPFALFEERTGLAFATLEPLLAKAVNKGLVTLQEDSWQITALGRQYTNDLQQMFLPE